MADSGETNGTGAAATETTGEEQQVRSSVTQKLTYYKTVILPTHLKPRISNLISCCELPILNILVQRHFLYFLIFVLFFFNLECCFSREQFTVGQFSVRGSFQILH